MMTASARADMEGASIQPQVVYVEPPTLTQNIEAAYNKRRATVLGFFHLFCGVAVLTADIFLSVRHTKFRSMGKIFGRHFFTGIWTSGFFLVSGGLAVGGGRSGNKYLVVATLLSSVISAVTAGFLIIHSSVALESSNFDSETYGSNFHLEMDYQEYQDFQEKEYQDYLDGLNSTQLAEFHKKIEEFDQYEDTDDQNELNDEGFSVSFSYSRLELLGHIQVANVAPSIQLTAGLLMLVAGILSSLLTCRPLFCAPRKTTSGGQNSLNFSLGDNIGVEQEATVEVEKEPQHGRNYRRF